MTPQERRELVIGTEGNMLSNCSRLSADQVADYARCYIDGTANALIRMEGAEEAARFIFALSDRVAGGLRTPTDFRAPMPPLPVVPHATACVEPPAAAAEAPSPLPLWRRVLSRLETLPLAYVLGLLHGVLVALLAQAVRAP